MSQFCIPPLKHTEYPSTIASPGVPNSSKSKDTLATQQVDMRQGQRNPVSTIHHLNVTSQAQTVAYITAAENTKEL